MSIDAKDTIAQLEAAIKAQEGLRPTFGDAIVDASIAALRDRLAILETGGGGAPGLRSGWPGGGGDLASRALATLQSHLPEELAAKARAATWAEGERRQVTLIFADLSGFTSVSETADPEVIRAFQHDLFRELARIIYQYEGFIEKFVGDAILAIFGAPVSHEDDAERALRAALAMRERMAFLNRRWAERLGSPVTLHVGVNTGSVVAGIIGSDLDGASPAYAVTGDTVNTAARLQNAAQPSQVLVSRTTYRLAHQAFTFQVLEPIAVRNRREPVDVYELLRARLFPGKVRGIPELREAFVGRADALTRLEVITTRLIDGDRHAGHIVLITGEAGIGKTRLIAEWRERTRASVQWLEGRCFAHTSSLSYAPFLDLLRRLAGISDEDTERRARTRLDRAIEARFPGDLEARAIFANLLAMRLSRQEAALLAKLQARELRERFFKLARELARQLIRDRPLVLFLEDMQWADVSTIDLLENMLPLAISGRMVVVVAARPDHEALLNRLTAKLAEPELSARTTRMQLEPLSSTHSLELVRQLLSVPEVPPKLVDLICSKAEGNPFFVEEIIRALIERGALTRKEQGWVATALLHSISNTIPDTLQGLIMARIDRLPDETKHVVQYAAVIGRTFLYRVLLAIAESSPSLDADLSHLQRTELIKERSRQPEVEYIFQHALTQEMAYQSLLKSRCREIHRRVGKAMERIFAGRLAEQYAILADHFQKGEVMDKSAEYYLNAGEQASRTFAPEARGHFERGLDALEKLPASTEVKRRRVEATIALTRDVLLGSSQSDEDISACVERLNKIEHLAASVAATRAATAEDRKRLARVHGWLGRAYSMRGDLGNVSQYLDKVQPVYKDLVDPELAGSIGQMLLHRGQFRRAEEVLADVVDVLQSNERWPEWIHANGALAVAQAASGRYEAGLQRAERGAARATNLQGLPLLAAAQNYLGFTLLLGGDWERAEQVCNQNMENVRRLGHPGGRRVADTLHCGHLRASGRPEDLVHLLDCLDDKHDRCLDGKHAHGPDHPLYSGWHAAFHAEMDFRTHAAGGAEALESAHDRAVAAVKTAQGQGDAFAEGLAWRVLGQVQAGRGADQKEFDDLMKNSFDRLDTGGCTVEAARTLVEWGKLGLERGDPDAKGRLREAATIFKQAELTGELEQVRAYLKD